MKTNWLFIFFVTMFTFSVFSQEFLRDPEFGDSYPLQAAVCDVAGIGHLISQESTQACIRVETLWIGNPTNLITIYGSAHFPTNTPFVFFATKFLSFLYIEPIYCRYAYIFNKSYHQNQYTPDGLFTLNGDESWFPSTPTNQALVNWCSNLVYTSQITTNRMAFYELIRDGFRLNPPSSRIHVDSHSAFVFFHYYYDTNFMKTIWSDTNLIGKARGWVGGNYQLETQQFLIWPTNQLAPQVLE